MAPASIISNSELADAREQQETTFRSTCDLYTITLVNDKGSFSNSPSVREADLACRLGKVSENSGREYSLGGTMISIEALYHLTLPYGTVIKITDRVKIGTEYYEVLDLEDSHDFATAVRVIIYKIDPDK